ncbi:MAG TPA: PaaX family transcriptional regulator C-terminal domain-containing protein [Acidimicrobiales bacterium]|nr:PaaX family transcriptional regulator C-terminal domain-containing protein [Acidimicrobiales bacterium]
MAAEGAPAAWPDEPGADRRPLTLLLLLLAGGDHVPARRAARLAALTGIDAATWDSCLEGFGRRGLVSVATRADGDWLVGTPESRRMHGHVTGRFAVARAGDMAGRQWDGRWRLVAFQDANGAAAIDARQSLIELGGAALNEHVVVLTRDWPAQLELPEQTAIAWADHLVIGSTTTPREVAARLWPIDDVAAGYRAFCDRWSGGGHPRRDAAGSPTFAAADALELLATFWQCFARDPVLPPELLSRPWPGRQARNLLATSFRGLNMHSSDRAVAAVLRMISDALEPAVV